MVDFLYSILVLSAQAGATNWKKKGDISFQAAEEEINRPRQMIAIQAARGTKYTMGSSSFLLPCKLSSSSSIKIDGPFPGDATGACRFPVILPRCRFYRHARAPPIVVVCVVSVVRKQCTLCFSL